MGGPRRHELHRPGGFSRKRRWQRAGVRMRCRETLTLRPGAVVPRGRERSIHPEREEGHLSRRVLPGRTNTPGRAARLQCFAIRTPSHPGKVLITPAGPCRSDKDWFHPPTFNSFFKGRSSGDNS